MVGKWLHERKTMLFRDLVSEYLDNRIFFDEIIQNHQKTGRVQYSMMEHWVGTESHKGKLWTLKDRCHYLLRNDKEKGSILGYLFDWTIGSIFHQCIKLKEDVYQLEAYAPQYERLVDGEYPTGKLDQILREMEQRMNVISTSLKSELAEIASLFQTADAHLARLLPRHSDNSLLVRFLIHNRHTVERVYGKDALDRILIDMYPPGLHEAYYMAGLSYLDGGWYKEAMYLFQTGLTMAPGHEGLRKSLAEVRIREEQNMEKENG
ncbi:MAG: hypothetical protein JRG73_00970 [Deltaproteobacteria bacterium]|nr:hypothetical protein [Deltaproteobacteria bacterium]MBW2305475.1 hypothetical protein [Deltaproteobacteria bacterium]